MSHPLVGNQKWNFYQPDVGFRAHYVAVNKENGERETLTVEASSTCREGVIRSVRQVFQIRLTNFEEYRAAQNAGWSPNKKPVVRTILKDVDLTASSAHKRETTLKIQWHKNWMKGWEDFPVEKFIRVCDAVIGPIAVLLGPHRPEGDWWRTNPERAVEGQGVDKYVHWFGSDSWFLAHPATVAIATGLYRQCFLMCGAGVADQIIESLSEEEISEVMSTNSQKLALLAIKKTRPWIEVPVAKAGYQENYAFPLGFWRRLTRLQRAARRFGYEEALGQPFHTGWATTGGTEFQGVYGFWGTKGELTDHHKHLMRIGAPRRITSGKPASRSA